LPGPDGKSQGDHQLGEIEDEVQRQREELAALHKQLDTRGRRRQRITLFRQIVAALLAFLAALGLTFSVIGLWAGNTT
jgi:fatty acid desaturase